MVFDADADTRGGHGRSTRENHGRKGAIIKRECKIVGCLNASFARGWCKSHYSKWKRHGDPLKERLYGENLFWARTVITPGCWIWKGNTLSSGYGMLYETKQGKQYREGAHRFSYKIHVGDIPHGMFVCHKCDVPNCVNPDHLFLGTAKDNNKDMLSKGRAAWQRKTHCKNGHELTPDNFYITNRSRGCSERRCKICHNESKKRAKSNAIAKGMSWALPKSLRDAVKRQS